MDVRSDFTDSVGNTPLIKLRKVSELTGCEIYGKAEFLNPGGSVKDRAAKYIILDAEERGVLRAHQVVRVAGIGEGEITSGSFSPTLNKSIALARVPAATGDRAEVEIRGKWYPVRVVQPSFVRHGKPLI